MINCTANSRAKKTGGIAQNYRAGEGEIFATCPDRCPLKPYPTGTTEIDREYESAVRRAVPRKGVAFLFTHFKPEQWAEKNRPGLTVFNFSADSLRQAAAYIKRGVASVAVVPESFWEDTPSRKVTTADGVKMVRCPDETMGVGCVGCGNGNPLCSRHDREYGIVFTAHGSGKSKAADNDQRGGCYAAFHFVGKHWRDLSKRTQPDESDAEKIRRFAKSLPPRSIFRPHIAGDLGKA
tara:strand:- start:1270 stop:1980 length:711 start_codon:yes stop_codon:yes gene_type:complete